MNTELKRELERRIPDNEIPPLSLDSIRKRGGHLRWRHRAAIAGSGLLAVAVLMVGTLMLLDDDPQGLNRTRPDSPAPENETAQLDSVVSLDPNRVRAGDRAELRVDASRGSWGPVWSLEQQESSTWVTIGWLIAEPGKQWTTRFQRGSDADESPTNDFIPYSPPASIDLEIPELEPGRYRFGQVVLIRDDRSRQYAGFEVIE